ncbi:MAG: cofactor-independent phosphoglycerate mutase [Planctomycetota bacterium]|jgi:2,3-bisphosphoglycerate-independent phosphoglycerate mutase|nr:cofactor-independent phosphoglycerate mutase [Planctomycetota bacterium]
MKHILVIPDGAADEPRPERGGKTVLELAKIPALDALAREGRLLSAVTVPEGMHPGSDVANLALLGYDPKTGYTGRAALEAAALGVAIPPGDAAFRANLVTLDGRIMDDYSAGHITGGEGRELIGELDRDLGIDGVRLFPGVGYRHLCLMESAGADVPECTPPHDIMGRDIGEHLPRGQFASWILEVERTSRELLPNYEVNKKREAEGKKPANSLWLWGGATAMRLENFAARHRLASAGLITAVDLLRGIGRLAGLDVIEVPGATAYLDTNFAGKGRAALDYIYDHDFVVVHVEAPDEAGHNGDPEGKIKALEDIDRHILTPLSIMARYAGDWRIMVSPDHPTPIALRSHSSDPIPCVLWGPGLESNGAAAFSEREAARVGGEVLNAQTLLSELFDEKTAH